MLAFQSLKTNRPLQLSAEQLNILGKDALIIIEASLQEQLNTMSLHIIPETFIVDEHHVHVHASKDNAGTIIKTECPAGLFRNSIATASLVTSMINGKKTFMWVYRNRPTRGTHPIVLFDWQSSRRSDHPRNFLKNFSGTDITDGYQVYHKIASERQNLKDAGCWIHVRRHFSDIIKSVGVSNAKGTIAQKAYDMITEILHIDNDFDDLPTGERQKQRQAKLLGKVDAYFEWVKHKYTQVGAKSAVGKALAYSINHEVYLRVFFSDDYVPPDNNYAEQTIRPFTIRRKNYTFIETGHGAKASATIYSIVETVRANELNTYKYLELLLTELPKHTKDKNLSFIDDLLP